VPFGTTTARTRRRPKRRRTSKRRQRARDHTKTKRSQPMLERKPINGGSDPASPDHARDRKPPRTTPRRSPTPAPAAAAPSPAQASAIQRGAARWGGERGGPGEARIRGRPPLGSRSGANRGALPHRRRLCSQGCGFQWCGHGHRRSQGPATLGSWPGSHGTAEAGGEREPGRCVRRFAGRCAEDGGEEW